MEVRAVKRFLELSSEQDGMPIYAFRCRGCGLEFEELVPRVGQTVPCPQCGREDHERLMTVPAAGRKDSGGDVPGCGAPPPDCGFS
jgi:putative FmdB family regulatory protein